MGRGALKAPPGVIPELCQGSGMEPSPTPFPGQHPAIGLFTTLGQSRLRGSSGAASAAFPTRQRRSRCWLGKISFRPCPATLSPFPSKPEESPFKWA